MACNFCSGSHNQIYLCIIWNTKNAWFVFHIHFYCILYYWDVEKSFNYRPRFALFSSQFVYLHFRYSGDILCIILREILNAKSYWITNHFLLCTSYNKPNAIPYMTKPSKQYSAFLLIAILLSLICTVSFQMDFF